MKISYFFALLLLVTAGTSRAQSSITDDYVSNKNNSTTHSALRGNDSYDGRNLQNLACTTLPTTGFFRLIDINSNYGLTVKGATSINGATLLIYPVGPNKEGWPFYEELGNWRFESVGNGYYHIIAESSSNGVNGEYDGNSIVLRNLQPGPGDDWCFVNHGGNYAIYNRVSGKVLNVVNGSRQAGAMINQAYFGIGSHQLWQIQPTNRPFLAPTPQQRPVMAPTPQQRPVLAPTPQQRPVMAPTLQQACETIQTTGFFKLIAMNSIQGLTVKGATPMDGATLILYPVGPNKENWPVIEQLGNWRFESVGNGYYHIIAESSSNGVNGTLAKLEKYWRLGENNGNSIVLRNLQPGPGDEWCFVNQGAGYYAIYNRGSGKVLNVENGARQAGAMINQADFVIGSNQLWQIQPKNRPFLAPTPQQRPVMAPTPQQLPVMAPTPRQRPVQAPTPQQRPVMAPTPQQACTTLQTTGFFNIIAKHSNQALNVANLNNGAALIQSPIEQAVDSNWRFESVGNCYYQIIAQRSGKAVNVLGAGKNNGNSIVLWDKTLGTEDDWCFVEQGNGYYAIFNRGSGKALDVQGVSQRPGEIVHQWDFVNGSNQLWKVVPRRNHS